MNIETWNQDITNVYLSNREINTFGKRTNYLFPPIATKVQTYSNYNTNTRYNYSEKIVHDNSNLRNVEIENTLYLLDKPLSRDTMSLTDAQNLEKNKQSSNHLIYRTFHTHEINSPCYPNIDRIAWGNTTKALHETLDQRDAK